MPATDSLRPVQGKSLAQWLAGVMTIPPDCERKLDDIYLDSRDCGPRSAFIALDGEQHRGTDFTDAAVDAGATVVVSGSPVGEAASARLSSTAAGNAYTAIMVPELAKVLSGLAAAFYEHPSKSMACVAVTGTNGKTSVTHYAAQLSSLCGMPGAVIGTLGYGIEGNLRPTRNTTPDAVSIQRQLAELKQAGAQSVFLEASSHALVQGRLDAIEIDVALLTNLTRDHLDYHGSQADYAKAKFSLFQRGELVAAVLNDDDYYGSLWRHELAGRSASADGASRPAAALSIMSYSLLHATTFCASDLSLDPKGMRCAVDIAGASGQIRLGLHGEFNLSNVLAACACVYSVMVNHLDRKRAGELLPEPMLTAESRECAERIVSHCGRLRAVAGRLQMIGDPASARPGSRQVVVDYAHTPDALQKTLTSLKQHGFANIVTVLGCGGNRDRGKRALMGEIASLHSSSIYLTSDNPRGEDPFSIIRDIQSGTGTGNATVTVIEQRDQAIAAAIAGAGQDALVLVAGKGHEAYQEYAGVRYPFSDADVVKQILADRAGQDGLQKQMNSGQKRSNSATSKKSSAGKS